MPESWIIVNQTILLGSLFSIVSTIIMILFGVVVNVWILGKMREASPNKRLATLTWLMMVCISLFTLVYVFYLQ